MTDAADMPRAAPHEARGQRPSPATPAANDRPAAGARHPAAEPEGNEAGATGAADATSHDDPRRAGEDSRRRGWFWHWNNVITQYAPLLGLKGVGLLNSYTVWTDRREESPHRGYAFPSQQAESGFYGEERSELITINKILVALDLIEIRKEMLPRTDSQGRRWKVPHNLYRVKDRPDGIGLRAGDVLRVVELAERDDDVYRYVRRVFSSRFAPIDRDNVWHAILAELAEDARWQAMRARTAQQEAKASARTRAGHDTRAGRARAARSDELVTNGQNVIGMEGSDEHGAEIGEAQPDSVAGSNTASGAGTTSVAPSNNGSIGAVAVSNEGIGADASGAVAASNLAPAGDVGQSNTTYDQPESTTTTTTTTALDTGDRGAGDGAGHAGGNGSDAVTHGFAGVPEHSWPAGEPAALALGLGAHLATGTPLGGVPPSIQSSVPTVEPLPSAVVAADFPAPLQSTAGGMARAAGDAGSEPDAGAGAPPGSQHGCAADEPGGPDTERSLDQPRGYGPVGDPGPLVVSLFEAANDRRATPLERLLLAELERTADPAARAAGHGGAELVAAAIREAVSSGSAFVAPKRLQEIVNRWIAEGGGPCALPTLDPPAGPSPARGDQPGPAPLIAATGAETLATPPDAVRLPGGRNGTNVWNAVLDELARLLDPGAFERLLAGSTIVRYRQGCVEVRVGSVAAAEKLSAEYHALVARRLNERLPRPVDLRFSAADDAPLERGDSPAPPVELPAPAALIVVSRSDADAGRQFWRSVLSELAPLLRPNDLERLADVVPLAQDATGRLLLGAPTRHVARLLDLRYRADLERAISRPLGRPTSIHPVEPTGWSIHDD